MYHTHQMMHQTAQAWDWPSYMSPETLEAGLKVRTASYTRHHVNITMVKAKASGNYVNSMLALREALDSGCDEAIMLDPEGYVSEGSAESFFMVRDGVIYTPDLTSCLDGLTRDTVFKLAADHGTCYFFVFGPRGSSNHSHQSCALR